MACASAGGVAGEPGRGSGVSFISHHLFHEHRQRVGCVVAERVAPTVKLLPRRRPAPRAGGCRFPAGRWRQPRARPSISKREQRWCMAAAPGRLQGTCAFELALAGVAQHQCAAAHGAAPGHAPRRTAPAAAAAARSMPWWLSGGYSGFWWASSSSIKASTSGWSGAFRRRPSAGPVGRAEGSVAIAAPRRRPSHRRRLPITSAVTGRVAGETGPAAAAVAAAPIDRRRRSGALSARSARSRRPARRRSGRTEPGTASC